MMARSTAKSPRENPQHTRRITRFGRHLAQSIMLEEAGTPGVVKTSILLISALITGFVLWSMVVQFNETTVAIGEIRPVNEVQPVQHFEGGIVEKILVRDGALVKAGDTLIRLQGALANTELERMQTRLVTLDIHRERLKAFALERNPDFGIETAKFAPLRDEQKDILSAQNQARRATEAVLQTRITEQEQALGSLVEQEATATINLELIAEELAMHAILAEKGLVSQLQLIASKRALNQAQGALQNVQARRSATRAALQAARQALTETWARLRNEALREVGDISIESAQLQEEMGRLLDRAARLAITAPSDGIVNGLTVKSPGAVIAPGAKILEIVPIENELVAEVNISPRDIGHMRLGEETMVKISSFNYARFGGIEGRLVQVSAGSFKDENGEVFFKGLIELSKDYVGPVSQPHKILPGMTVEADIKTGEKSLFQYMIRPVYNAVSTAFRER